MGTTIATSAGFSAGDPYKGRLIGRVLIKQGKLSRDLVHSALFRQKELRSRGIYTPLGAILVEMKLCSQSDVDLALRLQSDGQSKE